MNTELCPTCGGSGHIPTIEALIQERTKAGLTQKQLAERMAVSAQYVCDLEKKRRTLSAGVIAKYAAALGIKTKTHKCKS